MTFSISAKIQDSSQNFVSKINAFLHFTQKFKIAAKNSDKVIFAKCRQYTLQIPCGSDKDGKPDSWFLFDLYKRKRNPVTKIQVPVPEMLYISHQNL